MLKNIAAWRGKPNRSRLEDRLRAVAARLADKNPYLRGHILKARHYALLLARELKLGEELISALSLGGYVYDIGVTTVPSNVLFKASSLDDAETDAVRMHVLNGYRIVRNSGWFADLPAELMLHVWDIILFHHERWDGRGYPFNLERDHIPLVARVMAVADTFSAMTTNRPYRLSIPQDQVLLELARKSGTQFDPQVVFACYDAWREGLFRDRASQFALSQPVQNAYTPLGDL